MRFFCVKNEIFYNLYLENKCKNKTVFSVILFYLHVILASGTFFRKDFDLFDLMLYVHGKQLRSC